MSGLGTLFFWPLLRPRHFKGSQYIFEFLDINLINLMEITAKHCKRNVKEPPKLGLVSKECAEGQRQMTQRMCALS